jgi:SAM-dependent methyltransferase
LVLSWVLGAILLIAGVLWHLFVGSISNPRKLELLQKDFREYLGRNWDGKGKVLDIGTGSGRAAIEIDKHFPEAHVMGTDLWSRGWRFFGMSKPQAETNARIENMSDRCAFQHGNALDMPFEDGEFQLVVCSFVFHEVGIPDRTQLFREAVRVIASGCIFMILDQFNSLDRAYKVGNVSELLAKIEELGVEDVEHRSLKEAGVRLGGASHFRRIAYVSGRKVGNPEASGKQ